jgi:protein-S-isoprenylcysteine O-methyltransferase Ste14
MPHPIRSVLAVLVGLAVLLFLPAGTWRWPNGWLFFAVFTASGAVCVPVLMRVNPDVLAARSRLFGQETKRWDRVLVVFLIVDVYAIVVVGALDDGRFHWSAVPAWICALGYLLFLAGFSGSAWAEAVNKFAEPSVRIQTERGHTVVSTGPYAIVRHPLYLFSFAVVIGTALALGSLWALVPAIIACLTFILRTHWEDQTLQAELPGYKEFAQRVRFKLLPGVW